MIVDNKEAKPTQLPLSSESQDLLIQHVNKLQEFFSATFNIRQRMESIDRSYQRSPILNSEQERARRANRYGDIKKLQDGVVPIVQPQVDSMQAYLSGVYLTGNPLFGFVSDPENIDAALMYETIVDENAKHGGWIRQLSIFFKDVLKYNIGAVEVDWCKEVVYQLDADAVQQAGNAAKQRTVLWEGNKLARMDLYNSIWDTRCAPADVHKVGEFFGYTEAMPATILKQFIQNLDGRIAANVNNILTGAVDFASAGNTNTAKYYIPQVNPSAALDNRGLSEIDWFSRAGLTSTDTKTIPTINAVATYYLRIIPDNFKMRVPQRNNPQVWKVIIVNGRHIIFAERLTNLHNWLPVIMAQPEEDGLDYQTKSYAENAETFQDIATAIWTASLAAQRRAVYDRIFYDPSRIRKEDINSTNPIARIPVKSNAYNKPVNEAYSHGSFTNDQFSSVGQQLQMVNSMANTAQGSNPAQQGQFVKGNKTRHEYNDVMGHSTDRQQTLALFIEDQFFIPVKHILKLNIMQFSSNGQIFSYSQKKEIAIDPLKLRQASVAFEVSDGMLPTDKIIAADTLQVAIQAIAASPQLQLEFDLIGFMLYYFKTQGAKSIEKFKLTPKQQEAKMAQMQQMAAPQAAPIK